MIVLQVVFILTTNAVAMVIPRSNATAFGVIEGMNLGASQCKYVDSQQNQWAQPLATSSSSQSNSTTIPSQSDDAAASLFPRHTVGQRIGECLQLASTRFNAPAGYIRLPPFKITDTFVHYFIVWNTSFPATIRIWEQESSPSRWKAVYDSHVPSVRGWWEISGISNFGKVFKVDLNAKVRSRGIVGEIALFSVTDPREGNVYLERMKRT